MLQAVTALGLVALTAGVALAYADALRRQDVTLLTSCMRVENPVVAWTCKQAIHARGVKPDEAKLLNEEAGAVHALSFADPEDSKKMLELFLASGVDINAVGRESRRTALHSLISSRKVDDIRLVLSHGARTDIRDGSGRTPLEYALELQSKNPGESYDTIVAMLRTYQSRSATSVQNP